MAMRDVLFKRYFLVSVLLITVFALPAFAQEAAKVDSMRVDRQTAEGLVIGAIHRATDTISWKGIPYAKPPVGDLRWKAPVAPEKRSAPLKAAQFCEVCPEYVQDPIPGKPWNIMGKEDCLYLNIWRPRSKVAGLPVYLWIHGGGNSIQWPLLSDTDLGLFANRTGMVVVSLNYRLGPMGFFSHPALRTGDKKTDSGNFGLLDIIQAISWVQANIQAFGGDPGNVTIAGESAGGENVISLMASPLARGLFHRAVVESGVIRPSSPAKGAEHANGILAKLMARDGSAPDEKAAALKIRKMSSKEIAAYFRSKSSQDFLDLYPEGRARGMITFPVTFGDGYVMPADLYGAFRSGQYNKVPVLTGTNKEETKIFQMGDPRFSPWIRDGSLFKDPARAELYDLVAHYESSGWKVMGVDNLARILRSNADQPPVFAYHFLWGAGGVKNSVEPFPASQLIGSCHTLEIDFVFGTEAVAMGNWAFSPKNRPGRVALSNAMMNYWAHFARSGNPNREGSGLPTWAPWSNIDGAPKCLLLDADLAKPKIEMTRKELTNTEIEQALQAEPRAKEILPFWETSRFRLR